MTGKMVADLRREMKAEFRKIGGQFRKIDDRFAAIDERFRRIDDKFAAIDERFRKVDAEFVAVRAEIQAEGEKTRRHFDVAVEQFRDYVTRLANGTAHNAARLDEHDRRITALERPLG